MTDLNKIYLFRMTHIENISHILRFGITHRNSENANPNYVPIGDGSLITSRNSKLLPNGKRLGDYIPFYFGVRTPMLIVMQKGWNGINATDAANIVYCITSVQQMINHNLDFIFSNGHANSDLSDFFTSSDIINVETIVDFDATKVKWWNSETDTDLKRRKEAEFLVGEDIPYSAIRGYVVFNEKAKSDLVKLNIDKNIIIVNQNYYF